MQYKRTITITVEIISELLHTLNEKHCFGNFHINEDPEELTKYELDLLTETLDQIVENLWWQGENDVIIDAEIISKMC